MSEMAAARRPCDCGERDHLEGELQKSRDLVGALDDREALTDAVDNLLLRAAPVAAAFRNERTSVTGDEYDGFLQALAALQKARAGAP